MVEGMTKKGRLDVVLAEMMNVGNVDGAVVTSREGLLMASRVPPEVDDRIVSALFSSVTAAAETALVEMGHGAVDRVVLSAKDGQVIIVPAGPKAVLGALVRREAPNLGLILTEMETISKKIGEIIG
jgi:predicted regulator of Ras-like GTPase activity (Roadblock/LC7/MglB family)